ncbi:unnamed protein product [Ixodes hexagonus]
MDLANAEDGLEPTHYGGFLAYAVGVSLLVASFYLLLWNEHRAAAISKALEQALTLTTSIHDTDVDSISKDGTHLVHVVGHLTSSKVVVDDEYNVTASAVKLRRLVEMYQWVEKNNFRQYGDADGIGMEQDYSYEPEWRSELVDSTLFTKVSCVNPTSFPVQSRDFVLSEVYVGNVRLSESLVLKIDNFQRLNFSTNSMEDGFLYISESGGAPEKPEVGDIRISFLVAGILGEDKVSVVSECQGQQLRPYVSAVGIPVELLEFGELTAEAMFKQASTDNGITTSVLRSIAWFFSFMGFTLLSPVLHTLARKVPRITLLVPADSSPMQFSTYTWLLLMFLSWAVARPMHAVATVGASVLSIFTISRLINEA